MAEASKTSGNDAVRAVPWLDIDGPVGAAMAGSSGTPSVPARTHARKMMPAAAATQVQVQVQAETGCGKLEKTGDPSSKS